jgi:hypothetical protein
MIVKKSSQLSPLTHELAKKISTMLKLPGERGMRTARLNFFQNHLKAGTFLSPTWSIVTIKGTDQEFRADGQCTSTCLAALAPEDFPKGLNVTVQHWEIDSIAEDGAALFDMFDNPQAARTNTDAMGVHVAQFAELAPLPSGFLVKAANAIDFYMKELERREGGQRKLSFTNRKHGHYFDEEEHRRFALWLFQWSDLNPANQIKETKVGNSWMIGRSGIGAEMLTDWKQYPQIATEFWNYVLRSSHPEPSHDTREMGEKFKEWNNRPKFKQDRFKSYAHKMFDRFRRLLEAEGISGGAQAA